MTREELRAASEALQAAAEGVEGELRDRVRNQAAQLAELAEREPGPDHGRLDRHQRTLDELQEAAAAAEDTAREGDPPEHLIGRASDHIGAYRETLEGV